MAGKRYSIPNADDTNVTINNINYKNSDTVSDEAKENINSSTTKETEKMMNSVATVTIIDTSPVSGCIDDVPPDSECEINEKKIKQAEVEKLKYAASNNPNYYEEMSSSDEMFFSSELFSGDSGYTYQEEDLSNFFVVDENGFTYVEETSSVIEPLNTINPTTANNNVQDIKTKLSTLKVSKDFMHPTNGVGNLSSNLGLRILDNSDPKWKFHAGIDIGTSKRANVVAYSICDSVVTKVNKDGYGGGYGNYVEISFTYKDKKFWAKYAHLADVYVEKNDKLVIGQPLGLVGATGGNYPIHLHFEIKDGQNRTFSNFTGNINNSYGSIKSDKIAESCLGWIGNSKEKFGILPKFRPYIDPTKFLNNPTEFV
jgi:murein DD-endopeptidase MepM/ murein hydrolase activator NlpD